MVPETSALTTSLTCAGSRPRGTYGSAQVSSAISTGTEMATFTARHGIPFYGWPFEGPSAMGYLNVGRVDAAGSGVAAPAVGDLVYTFRPHREAFDFPVTEPWWRVPERIDPAVAGFTYLISLGAHGLRRAALVPGERVAVVGLGASGTGTVAIAKLFGSHVTAIDAAGYRRSLALRLGADEVVSPSGRGGRGRRGGCRR